MQNKRMKKKEVRNKSKYKDMSKISLKEQREQLVLYRKPLTTILYFVNELGNVIYLVFRKSLQYRKLWFLALTLAVIITMMKINGFHQDTLKLAETKIIWSCYWIGLGILSSVGLGTGLHTFVLYLGPHIASVTIAAYECGGVDFPEPPYPDRIICSENGRGLEDLAIWTVLGKVFLEAFMWGAGTAVGELPPYLMAKAAKASSRDPDSDDELDEFYELQKKKNQSDLSRIDKIKVLVGEMINKVGFLGILLSASIPNPLFDIVGITCGHFDVPFLTFFGATLIGKSLIKVTLQTILVIITFNNELIKTLLELLGSFPVFGKDIKDFVNVMLETQKSRLHKGANLEMNEESEENVLALILQVLVFAMIGYFVISIIHSMAQSYHKRVHNVKDDKKK